MDITTIALKLIGIGCTTEHAVNVATAMVSGDASELSDTELATLESVTLPELPAWAREDAIYESAPGTFLQAYGQAYASLPHRDALTAPEDVQPAHRYYLSADRCSGYALTANGDARYLFSTVKGRGDALVAHAVEHGARTLDCFDGYLPVLYARHGFVVVDRAPNWTPGGPDVVWMALQDGDCGKCGNAGVMVDDGSGDGSTECVVCGY